MDASGASSSTRPLDTRAQRRQQKKAARRLADEARIRELGAIRVQQQQQLRSTLASAMTTPSADALQQARADVVGLVNSKHRLDELDVPLSIVKAAVERIVISSNFEALLSLALQPLSFDPADYPDAFERDGKGRLYIRQDSLGTLDDLDAYDLQFPADAHYSAAVREQATFECGNRPIKFALKYAGQTFAEDVKDRLEADEVLPPQTRLGNWLKIRGPAARMSIWALRDVDMPAADAYEFRSSDVAQEMERILIAIVGLSALNSAVGGHSYPWDTQIYHGLSQDFFRHIDNKAPPANITTALNPSLAQPRLGNNIRSAIQEFLFRMRRDHGDATGTMVSGRALTRVMEIASSAVSPLRSLVVMKDITREEVTVNRPNLHYFGTEAGPGPRLERRLLSAIDAISSPPKTTTVPLPLWQIRMFWDLWLFLRHVLLFQVVLFLSQLLVLVQPQVIRVQSSKVSNIFLNGHIFNVETIQGYEWEDLPVSRWLDKVCSIYILDEPSCLLILALDPGSVKYDPFLSRHRTRLLYLAMLLQRGSELLIMRGKSPQEARQILISCDPFQEEVARVKKALEIDQHAVWSLRNQTALTKEEADERSTRMKMVATSAHERHGKAVGQPWSEERLRAWDDYVNSGPSDPWIITAALSTIPCPASFSPRSEEHKAWYCSRRSGVDLVLSAGQYDTPRRDPDQHEHDFDWIEYVTTRRRAQASRAVTRQLIVGGIDFITALKQLVKQDFSKPVRFTCCKACGLSFFSGDNTSHRCTEETDLIPVQRPQFDRSIMLVPSDAFSAFGEPEGGLPNELSTVAVLDVLRLSELWDIFSQYVQDRYPAALAELEATMNIDPRPYIILAAGTSIEEGEYDALVWAITALWPLMRGHPASEHRPTSRMHHKLRSNLVKSLQRDSAEAAIRIVCDVKPPCGHDEIASAINDKGERRRLQHPHPVSGTDRTTDRKAKISRTYNDIFDLDLSAVRDLLVHERSSAPTKDDQSLLLWRLSKTSKAHCSVRPMATREPSSTDLSVAKGKRRRPSMSQYDDKRLAIAMNEFGFIDFPHRRELAVAFGVTREALTVYIGNNNARLKRLRQELQSELS